jgi:hypothetical protein
MPEGAVLLREPDRAAKFATVSLDGAVTDRPGKGSGGHFSSNGAFHSNSGAIKEETR